MKINSENTVLRDMIESDLEDFARWFTADTKWLSLMRHGSL